MSNCELIKILENYNNYEPPAWVITTVSRLVGGVPEKYFNGLKIILLSNAGGLNHSRKRQKTYTRKRKVAIQECRGLYFQKRHGQSAYIELFIDKIIQSCPKILFNLNFFKDLVFSEALYHELGHHIHKTNAPEHKEREDVAEKWKKRLTRLYFRDRYFYSKMFLTPLIVLLRLLAKLFRLMQRRPRLAI
ncbi:MAG: hypothetical protein PHU44_15555 [Syntrophales bacterium]|nr:hypothetical protein [Syntrophales bacterium]